jgi:glycosyltransferase involved in cell wall biosynthesis
MARSLLTTSASMKQTTGRAAILAPGDGADDRSLNEGSIHAASPAIGVLHVVLSLGTGGTERLVVQICQRLQPRFRLAVCALEDPGVWAAELQSRGIDVVPLRRRPGFRPWLGRLIADIAVRYRATVLHCHHYSPFVYGAIAALLRPGLKTVYTEHGRLSDAPPSVKRRLVNPLVGRLPHAMYAVSHALRASMIAEGFPSRRLHVIHNGVDPAPPFSPFQRREARALLGVPESAFLVGTVARLDPVKDLATLIEAAARVRIAVPDIVLAIVGEGGERARLQEAAAQTGMADAVRFLGQRDDARRLLPGFDVYVNSSISEGVSLTILEAMAAGVPVVATRVGGTPEVVTDEVSGVLVPARDPSAMAEAIHNLAAQSDRARRMGLEARRAVEQRFTIDRMVDQYAEVYQRLAGGEGSGLRLEA